MILHRDIQRIPDKTAFRNPTHPHYPYRGAVFPHPSPLRPVPLRPRSTVWLRWRHLLGRSMCCSHAPGVPLAGSLWAPGKLHPRLTAGIASRFLSLGTQLVGAIVTFAANTNVRGDRHLRCEHQRSGRSPPSLRAPTFGAIVTTFAVNTDVRGDLIALEPLHHVDLFMQRSLLQTQILGQTSRCVFAEWPNTLLGKSICDDAYVGFQCSS